MPVFVCSTTRSLPEIVGEVIALAQPPIERFVLYSSEKLVSDTGQESRTWLLDNRLTERTGNGRTVVETKAELLAMVGSGKLLVTFATLVMLPTV